MKHKSIFTIFAALTMVLGFAMTGLGQQNDNAVIAANATVVGAVVVDSVQSLQFGNVTPGNTKTISTTGTVAVGFAGGTTETEGKFSVTKGANSQVTLTFALPSVLTKSGGITMPINFSDYGGNKCGAIDATTLYPFTPSAAPLVISNAAFAAAFAAASFIVHLGGTVVPTNTQAAGAYTANITLTATYN
ncbi:MAG: hypothetical protein M0Q51_03655 [Bacteroidales bacterium]|nr:hypothetical protein [Bacteroidales bacterium]